MAPAIKIHPGPSENASNGSLLANSDGAPLERSQSGIADKGARMKRSLIYLSIATCLNYPAVAAPNTTWNTVGYDAMEAVRSLLRDPGSAEFEDVTDYIMPNGGLVACGRVNAKNGFGGYTGYKRFVSRGVPELTVIEGQTSDFAKVWKVCR